MDQKLIADVESRAVADGEYMGLAAREEAANSHNNHGGRTLRQRLASTCLLAICCLTVLLFGVVNPHKRIELVDVIRGTAPWLNLFNGPRFAETPKSYGALPQHLIKTSFHYQPAQNWMNDPNGPTYYKGYYHLFHQYNQYFPVWGPNMSWAHAVSTDLIHWLYLEIALQPDQWYDAWGVWSGSSTIGPDGIPFIIYTGKMNNTYEETQNMAVPADPSDPLLRKWVKVPQNPIARRPAEVVDYSTFRDPTSAWQEDDGSWLFTVGSVVGETNTTGVAYLFKSKDLKHWELVDNYLYTLTGTGMWECVDFYQPDPGSQKYVLKASLFNSQHDVYALGSYDMAAHKFIPDNPELDSFGFESSRYDHGRVYASDTFFDPVKQRRIMLSWVNESDTKELEMQRGWSGFLTIPRTVAVDSKTGVNLILWPIEEVESLRIGKQVQTGVKLDAGAILKVDGATGSQLDVEVIFNYPDVSMDWVVTDEADSMNEQFNCSQGGSAHRGVFGPFGLLVLTDENFKEQTAVFFYISRSGNGQWITRVCSDETRSSLLPNVTLHVYGNPVQVLPTEDFLSLRVLVDQFVVESFAQGGRLAVTSRVYPIVAIGNLANLYLFNNGTTPITVRKITTWHMSQVIMNPY